MKNIAVLVSGGGTNLQAIIDSINNRKITNGRIAVVLSSNPEAYALERAKDNEIATCVVERTKYKSRDEYTAAIIEALEQYNVDLIVLAGFLYILSEEFVKKYPYRILNVHPALIPSFCGPGFYGIRVHKAVLESGVKVTGATVHFVNEVADGGPIILQKAVDVKEGDTPEILQKRVLVEAEWKLLPQAVELFCNDRLYLKNDIVYIKSEEKTR